MAGKGPVVYLATLQRKYKMVENDWARYAEESQNACPLTPSTDYAWNSCDQNMVHRYKFVLAFPYIISMAGRTVLSLDACSLTSGSIISNSEIEF